VERNRKFAGRTEEIKFWYHQNYMHTQCVTAVQDLSASIAVKYWINRTGDETPQEVPWQFCPISHNTALIAHCTKC
jgi:hypothetical protein